MQRRPSWSPTSRMPSALDGLAMTGISTARRMKPSPLRAI
jgi:hypothetical protein